MNNKKEMSTFKLKLLNDVIKNNENPFEVSIRLSSDEIKFKVEDIRYHYAKQKVGFDYLMEE